jgi:2-polyprenyl-3-methyl-5-hydroxy-6-metoxy-1,4-benzoquinol methylase
MNYLKEMAEQGYHPRSVGPFHRHMIPWLMRVNGIGHDAVVMDIGAGQGHGLLPLKEGGWTHLMAVDIDDYNFDLFRNQFGFQTLKCDISCERIGCGDAIVDAVMCFHLIEHLPKPDHLIQEVRRVLKPCGLFFLVTPDWRKQFKTFWRDPTHIRPFDKRSLERLFRMHGFDPRVQSWNARFGVGRFQAYRWIPRLGMIGRDILIIGKKSGGC